MVSLDLTPPDGDKPSQLKSEFGESKLFKDSLGERQAVHTDPTLSLEGTSYKLPKLNLETEAGKSADTNVQIAAATGTLSVQTMDATSKAAAVTGRSVETAAVLPATPPPVEAPRGTVQIAAATGTLSVQTMDATSKAAAGRSVETAAVLPATPPPVEAPRGTVQIAAATGTLSVQTMDATPKAAAAGRSVEAAVLPATPSPSEAPRGTVQIAAATGTLSVQTMDATSKAAAGRSVETAAVLPATPPPVEAPRAAVQIAAATGTLSVQTMDATSKAAAVTGRSVETAAVLPATPPPVEAPRGTVQIAAATGTLSVQTMDATSKAAAVTGRSVETAAVLPATPYPPEAPRAAVQIAAATGTLSAQTMDATSKAAAGRSVETAAVLPATPPPVEAPRGTVQIAAATGTLSVQTMDATSKAAAVTGRSVETAAVLPATPPPVEAPRAAVQIAAATGTLSVQTMDATSKAAAVTGRSVETAAVLPATPPPVEAPRGTVQIAAATGTLSVQTMDATPKAAAAGRSVEAAVVLPTTPLPVEAPRGTVQIAAATGTLSVQTMDATSKAAAAGRSVEAAVVLPTTPPPVEAPRGTVQIAAATGTLSVQTMDATPKAAAAGRSVEAAVVLPTITPPAEAPRTGVQIAMATPTTVETSTYAKLVSPTSNNSILNSDISKTNVESGIKSNQVPGQQQMAANTVGVPTPQNERVSEIPNVSLRPSNQPNPQLAMLREMTDAAAAGSRSYADSAPKASKIDSPRIEGTNELLKPTASLLPNSTVSGAMTTSESGHIRTASQGMPTAPLNPSNLQDSGTPPTRAISDPQSLMAALEAAAAGRKATTAPSTSSFVDGTVSPSKLGLSPLQGGQPAEIPHGQIAEGIRGKGMHISDTAASPGATQTTGMKPGDAGQSIGHSIGTDIRGGTTPAPTDARGIHAAGIPTSSDAKIGQAGGIPTAADARIGPAGSIPTSADVRGTDARVPQIPGQIPGQAIGNSTISGAPDSRLGVPDTRMGPHNNIPGAVGPGMFAGQHTQTGEHSTDEHTLHVPNLDIDNKTGHAGHKGKLHGVDQSSAGGIDLVGLGAAAGAGAGLATLFDQVRHGKKESPEQGGKADAGGSSKAWTSKGRLKHQVQPGETLDEISRKYFQENTIATLIVQINHAVLKPRLHEHSVEVSLIVNSIIDIPSPAEAAEFKKKLIDGEATIMNITYDSKSAHTERQPVTDALGGKEECPTCGQTTFKGNVCPRCSGNA